MMTDTTRASASASTENRIPARLKSGRRSLLAAAMEKAGRIDFQFRGAYKRESIREPENNFTTQGILLVRCGAGPRPRLLREVREYHRVSTYYLCGASAVIPCPSARKVPIEDALE